ncbi:MAG TPA: DEAD/DEAH box helicase family protein, partial [Candidatus Scatomorpha intestinigallinarum]|nr:DEAD/DEAH box helicase family protein [Candidatus Scatomorpha intestinigallinarum]
MDDVLRLGGNTEELRMRVAAEFEKRRSIDEIAAFLPTVYQGGNGFIIDGEKYAVWFSEDGIRVAHGEQARYERGAQLIMWADAAARIGELLGDGRFATKEEVTGAEDYEHELIARKLRDLQHDLSKGNEGLFPNLADVDGGYPEAVQKIAAKLADPEGREAVLGDYLAFREAYKADRSVLRFHYHDVDGIFVSLAAQLLERRKFTSDMERVPEVNSFITQDEIGDALSHGGGTVGSKWRIFKYFTEEHSLSEKAAVLKDLYGIGGRSHALSGATGSGENHDANGIRLTKPGCENVILTWSAVARRIDELIASDRYMTEAELAEYDLHTAAYAKYMDVKANNSDAIVLVGHGGNYYAYTPDAEQVSRTLDLREQHAGGLDYVVIPGEQLDEALEKLRSRSAVIYVDEAGVEHTLPFIISDAEREQYEKQLMVALVNDSAYVNAVRNSDRQNALDEGFSAIRRIAAASTDMRFQKLYHDDAEFRNGLRNDVLAAAYKEMSERGNVGVEQSETSHEPTPVVYIPVDGEWQGFPSVAAAEEAALEEFQKETRRRARNFRITDEHLGEGGAKTKCRANIEAIQLLKYLERNGFQASPEQQDVLSRYVGWGGIPEVFDESKSEWSKEYAELKALLTPEEYDAARGSTLNAHYTSPAVIRAIYEAVGGMGFEGGRILEPSMGVGNFFGLLPENMANSQLYGVELDSITGRIAKQLYPEADITVAGFETTNRPGFYDLAVGNVPFGQYQVHDPEYDRLGFSIHNYFAAKMLDQVRPGGLVAFVTSRYTLDAKDESVRRYLAERGELLGAIRLPNNAFRANAGTDVVSDIIFLQRREVPATELPDWVHVDTTPEGFTVNRYFIDHPDMVLGTPTAESTQYGRQDYTVAPIEGADLSEQLHEAVQNIHGEYTEREIEEAERSDILPADPDVRNYSFTLVDGEVYYREGGIMARQDVSAAMTDRIKGLMELRDCTRRLIQLQTEDASDVEIAAEQQRLNTLYDAYTAKHGLISNRENKRVFSDDSSYYLLCSLEILDEDGKLERKADMFTRRTIQPHRPVEHTETAAEALAVSLNELGRVDMEYMSRLCGKSDAEIAAELSGVIFRVPGEERYATADEYLSGNVREKLREAEAAAKADPSFNVNVESLRAAQPRELTASEIDVRLGATWIEPRYIEQFMVETFQPTYWASRSMSVNYSPYTSEWRIEGKNAVGAADVNAFSTYGTSRISAYKILENTLNLRDVRIYDKIVDSDGTERRVLNVKETTLAQQKQQVIKDAFRDWLWKDPKRRETLVARYNELFNSTRPREYDGSHLTFPGINPEIELREHQRNAIARILYGGNTLLAHEVGAGKTFTMAAAAMEAKRLGLCRKPMFAVPNHLTEQWASEFLRLYPSANVLVATKKDFEPANRKKFCARIATGDYDAVIIGHSQFERIPVSQERQERLLRSEIEDITEGINQLKRSSGERFSIKSMEKTKKSLEAKLKKLLDSPKDDVVTFEELGVDRLFVDEAHSHKNLYYHTKMQNVAGLSSAEAQKSSDMYMKCRYMDELTGSRGIVFATGTPVSNSM